MSTSLKDRARALENEWARKRDAEALKKLKADNQPKCKESTKKEGKN